MRSLRRIDSISEYAFRFGQRIRRNVATSFRGQNGKVSSQVEVTLLSARTSLEVEHVNNRFLDPTQRGSRAFEPFGAKDGVELPCQELEERGAIHIS